MISKGLLCAAFALLVQISGCQHADTESDKPVTEQKQPASLSTRASIAPITGETVTTPVPPPPPPPPPPCDCYYNKDCSFGWVCPVTGSCAIGTTPAGKIQDGECTFFLWASFELPDARLVAARAFTAYTTAIAQAAAAGGMPAQPLLDTHGTALAPTTLVEVEVLAMNLAVLVFGRTDIAASHPHDPGFVDVSGINPVLAAGGMTGDLQLLAAPLPTRRMFEFTAAAVATYLREPDLGMLADTLAGSEQAAPGFRGHGNCQSPHPVRNHHPFEFADAYDCVAQEVRHMLAPIERHLMKTAPHALAK